MRVAGRQRVDFTANSLGVLVRDLASWRGVPASERMNFLNRGKGGGKYEQVTTNEILSPFSIEEGDEATEISMYVDLPS